MIETTLPSIEADARQPANAHDWSGPRAAPAHAASTPMLSHPGTHDVSNRATDFQACAICAGHISAI